MRIALFILYLCFFLFTGNSYSYAFISPIAAPTHGIEIKQWQSLTNTYEGCPFIVDAGLDEGDQYLDDAEDEDEGSPFVYKFVVGYSVVRSHQYVLTYLNSCFSMPVPYSGRVSQKYIRHRALRI